MEGAELEFREEALKAVASKAMQRKTGARGLRTILENVLLDTMYELPSLKSVAKVVVDDSVIEGHSKPYILYRSDDGRAANLDEPRRARAPSPETARRRPTRRRPPGAALETRPARLHSLLTGDIVGRSRRSGSCRCASSFPSSEEDPEHVRRNLPEPQGHGSSSISRCCRCGTWSCTRTWSFRCSSAARSRSRRSTSRCAPTSASCWSPRSRPTSTTRRPTISTASARWRRSCSS